MSLWHFQNFMNSDDSRPWLHGFVWFFANCRWLASCWRFRFWRSCFLTNDRLFLTAAEVLRRTTFSCTRFLLHRRALFYQLFFWQLLLQLISSRLLCKLFDDFLRRRFSCTCFSRFQQTSLAGVFLLALEAAGFRFCILRAISTSPSYTKVLEINFPALI